MLSANPKERRAHLKRIVIGGGFGLLAGLLCPQLDPALQGPCRVVVILLHSLVNP